MSDDKQGFFRSDLRQTTEGPTFRRERTVKGLSALVVVSAGMLLAPAEPKQEETEEDLNLMQGTWELLSRELAGRESESKGMLLVIDKNKMILRIKFQVILEETFKIDATKDPKWFDTEKEGAVTLGIYCFLSKDALTICWTEQGAKSGPRNSPPKTRWDNASSDFVV